jgi:hypothetical protein
MKHVFTPLVLLILGFNCIAQNNTFREKVRWDAPDFSRSFILRNNIKAIHVRNFKDKKEPVGEYNSGITYEYDSKGNLTQVVEIKSKDTSRVHEYMYTERGVLGWKVMRDKTWNKAYKQGYRFNPNKTVFQEKSYEMLHNDEVMLLNTKQYIYDDDSVLVAIRWMESGRLAKTHKYEYDEDYNLVSEIFENGSGGLIKKVDYNYNAMGLIAQVTTERPGFPVEKFVYTYNVDGKTSQVVWHSGKELKGKVAYSYDQNGVLAKLDREMYQNAQNQPTHVCQVYQYEKYD